MSDMETIRAEDVYKKLPEAAKVWLSLHDIEDVMAAIAEVRHSRMES